MATPVFCCGFECGQQGTLGQHWNNNATQASFQTTTVKNGARAARFNPTAAKSIFLNSTLGNATVNVFQLYIRFTTLPNADSHIAIASTASVNCGVMFKQSDSKIYACREAAGVFTIGATGVAVTTGQWYRIDCKVNVLNNPWTIDVNVDGVACGQVQNAVAGSTLTQRFVGSNVNVTCDWFADDYALSFTAADFPLTPGFVNHFTCTADGTHAAGLAAGEFQRTLTGTDILPATTTAFQLVDDVPLESGASVDWINMVAPSATTDYVECVFGPAPGISTPTVAPMSIEVIAGIHQATTATGNMEIRLNDNGTTNAVYTAATVAGVTAVNYKRKHYALAPTGGAWTVASGAGNFNNLKVQFGSPSAGVDAVPDQYFDCIMVEAWFALPVALAGLGQVTATGFAPVVAGNVIAALGQLTVTGFAPTIQTGGAGTTVAAGTGQVTATGLAPVVAGSVIAGLGQVTATGLAPKLAGNIIAGLGQVTVTGFAPIVRIVAGTGQVIATGFAPIIAANIRIGLGQVIATGFAPQIAVTASAGLGQLTITGQAPLIAGKIVAGLGQPTLTGFAPTIAVSDNKTVSPGTGQTIATGLAPVIAGSIVAGTGQLTLNGFAPKLAESIIPGTGVLTPTGFAPVIASSIATGTGQLTVTGFAPVTPLLTSTGVLTVQGFAPVIAQSIIPGTGQLTITGQSFTITYNTVIGAGQLIATGFEPVIAVIAAPATGQVIATGQAPVISSAIIIGVGSLQVQGFAPNVGVIIYTIIGTGQLVINGFAPVMVSAVIPELGQLQITGFAPTIAVTNNQVIQPGTGQVVATGLAPTPGMTISPVTGQLSVNGFAPVMRTSVMPGTGQLSLQGFTPTLVRSVGTGQLIVTGFAPVIHITSNQVVQPGTGAVDVTGYAPVISVVIIPGTGSVLADGTRPAISNSIVTGTGELLLDGYQPFTDLIPVTGELTLSGYPPSVRHKFYPSVCSSEQTTISSEPCNGSVTRTFECGQGVTTHTADPCGEKTILNNNKLCQTVIAVAPEC